MNTNSNMGHTESEPIQENIKNMARHAGETLKEEGKKILNDSNGVAEGESEEGSITKKIEKLTTKIPSVSFLSIAVGSIRLSALLHLSGRKEDAQFVGQWVPTVLILGLYNKLVKLEGSE